MKLTTHTLWGRHVNVFIDGSEQRHCVAADDEAGRALCMVMSESGRPVSALLHRDWQPDQIEHDGDILHWVSGRVEFRFDDPAIEADARTHWREHEDDPLWAL